LGVIRPPDLTSHDAIVREHRESDPAYATEEYRLALEGEDHMMIRFSELGV
jgi:hypothetical protein